LNDGILDAQKLTDRGLQQELPHFFLLLISMTSSPP